MGTGYSRVDIVNNIASGKRANAADIDGEFDALESAFDETSGHSHDGTADEGGYVPLISDGDAKNKVVVDTINDRVGVFVEVAAAATEQIRIQDGAIVPVTDDDIDLGAASLEFKDLYIDGVAYIDDIQGPLTGNVTGDLTGNVTAASGSSSFTNVTINGTLDVTNTPIENVSDPTTNQQAATKTYVDTADALKLNLAGGTMSGAIDMGTSKVTGLGDPTLAQDAATKTYVDTADSLKLNLAGGTMSGAIAMGTSKITGLGDPTLAQDAATKTYVDTQVASVIDTAPAALDTLNELAAALGDDANFSTTVTNSIATKLPLAGGTMSGAIAMGTAKITGLGDPTLAQDATTKTYTDTADALKLNLAGGTMSGAIAMGTSKVTGLGDPTLAQDAATKTYVDTADSLKVNKAGDTMSGAIAMGGFKITGLGTPATGTDATTKTYVDTILGSATAAADSAAAALTSENNAATSYDSFDDRYLGAKASAPTVDNDGDALITGAVYFNSSEDQLYVRTSGAAWSAAAFDTSGALVALNNLSDLTSASTARTNLGLGTASTTASTDYATAAQGTTADSALQPAAIGATVQGYSAVLNATTASYTTAEETKLSGIVIGVSANNIVALDSNTNATFPNELKATQFAGTATSALSGTTPTLDMSVATQFTLTTSGNTTITIDPDNFDLSDALDGGCKLYVTQGATPYTLAFAGSAGVTIEYAGGTGPDAPAASTKDLYFITKQSATVVQVFVVGVDVQ